VGEREGRRYPGLSQSKTGALADSGPTAPVLPATLARQGGGRICQAGNVFVAAWQIPLGRRTITLSGMDTYPKGMLDLRLPPGYRVQAVADVLVLRRADGLMVAAFLADSADPKEVEWAAAEDHRLERQRRRMLTTAALQRFWAQANSGAPRLA
jgi:hypothetical protein